MINIFHYLLISLGINIILFIPAFIFKTDKLTDLSYSITFLALALLSLFLGEVSAASIILALMVGLWAIRLGVFLFVRIKNMKRDKRFDGIRESFPRFLRFWLLQGLAVWVILIPSLLFMGTEMPAIWLTGFVIWLIGFLVESVADLQKYNFRQKRKNKGKFIKSGLWKYSRHPNYFGEILCWVGVYLYVLPSLSVIQRLFSLISPVFILGLLLFVTGIPPLEKSSEKKWGKTKEYREYKRRTSILIPWLQKK